MRTLPHQLPAPVYVLWRTEAVRDAVRALAEIAGVRLHESRESGGESAVLILEETAESPPHLLARFHPSHAPYFGHGEISLTLEEETELLELMLAADTTLRGIVVGVLPAHGGAGATTLAFSLALHAATSADVALVDADPLSAGYPHWCGLADTGGLNWADLATAPVPFVPARLASNLPSTGRLRLLGPDRRAAMPPDGDVAQYAVSALARSHELTVVDLGREAALTRKPLLQWCDALLIVTTATPEGTAQAHMLAAHLAASVPEAAVTLVVNRVGSVCEGAAAAEDAGFKEAAIVRESRMLRKDLAHGIHLGQRRRSSMARDIARLVATNLPEGAWSRR